MKLCADSPETDDVHETGSISNAVLHEITGHSDGSRDDAEYWIGNTSTNIVRHNICNGEITETIRFNIYNGQIKLGARRCHQQ